MSTWADPQVHALAAEAAMKLVKNKGCVPKRPSYVADLRGYQLQGNLTLDDASANTTLKVQQLVKTYNMNLFQRSLGPSHAAWLTCRKST